MLSQWLFLKLLSLTYFFAFLSLHSQVLGLFGSKGIVPLKDYLGYRSSDSIIKGTALAGIILSVVAFMGVVPFIPLAVLWSLYLSFYKLGYPFLSFQWDALLIEVGFAALFFALTSPPPLMLFIWMWVLLFRLMLTSGLVKWFSGCPNWHAFKAMLYHFETQPLPNFGGYIAHHVSLLTGKFGVAAVLFLEGPAVLLLLGTAEMRLVGGLLQLLLQFMIIITGNYAFFNLLTIALIATVFDDKFIPLNVSVQALPDVLEIPLTMIGAFMVLMNMILLLKQFWNIPYFSKVIHSLRNYGILNTYGLFAVMTPFRDEVIIEGTMDRLEWKEYHFKYKPGLLNRGVSQIAPLHPRLDWQMWFIALGQWREESWFTSFIIRLLEPSKDVLALLAHDPFNGKPPLSIRAKRYRYHFTSFEEWKKTGNYWKREYRGMFLPEVMRENP